MNKKQLIYTIVTLIAVLALSLTAASPAFAKGEKPPKPDKPEVVKSEEEKGNKPDTGSYSDVWINTDGSYSLSDSSWWSHTTPHGYATRSEWEYAYYDQYGNLISQSDGEMTYHWVHCWDGGNCHYTNTWWNYDGYNLYEYKSVYSHGELIHTQYRVNGIQQ